MMQQQGDYNTSVGELFTTIGEQTVQINILKKQVAQANQTVMQQQTLIVELRMKLGPAEGGPSEEALPTLPESSQETEREVSYTSP